MNPYIVPGIDISRLINAEIIEYFVCSIFVIDPERLKEKTRKHEVLIPRQTVYYLCRKYLTNGNKIPFHRLAEKYGQDHATAMNGCKVISELIETREPRWGVLICQAEELIRSINEKGEKFNRVRQIA